MKALISEYFGDFTIWKKLQIGYFVSVIGILIYAFSFPTSTVETYLVLYMIPAFACAILVIGIIAFMAFCFVGHLCISVVSGKNPFDI